VPVNAVRFDPTKRKEIDPACLDHAIGSLE